MITMGGDAVTNRLWFDFDGTSVLVTGGTSGIGHAIASAFAAAGADVTVTGTRPDAGQYERDLSAFSYRPLEVRDHGAVEELAAAFDRLDVLVNNAGANFPDGRDEWDPDGFAAALDLNVEGAMRLTMGLRGALGDQHHGGGRQRGQPGVDDGVPLDHDRARLRRRQGGAPHPDPEPGRPLGRRTASGSTRWPRG